MKTTIVLISIVTSLSSFALANDRPKSTATSFGLAIVHALQERSADNYAALLPSVTELQAIMSDNAVLYGSNLELAKAEIAREYVGEVMPETIEAFNAVLEAGSAKGIVWQNVQFVRADESAGGVSLYFAYDQKLYHLTIEKAFFLNGKLKATPFISFN